MLGAALFLGVCLCDVVAMVLALEQGEATFVEVKVGDSPPRPGYKGLVNENAILLEFLNPLREVLHSKSDVVQTWAVVL